LVAGYSQVVYKYCAVGQELGHTHHQPNRLAVFVVQHICDYNGKCSVLPRRVRINGWFRDKSQCVQIVFVDHQFLLLSHFQIVLEIQNTVEKRYSQDAAKGSITLKFLKLLICLCVSVTRVSMAGRLRLFWNIRNKMLNENTAIKQKSKYRDRNLRYCNLNIGLFLLSIAV